MILQNILCSLNLLKSCVTKSAEFSYSDSHKSSLFQVCKNLVYSGFQKILYLNSDSLEINTRFPRDALHRWDILEYSEFLCAGSVFRHDLTKEFADQEFSLQKLAETDPTIQIHIIFQLNIAGNLNIVIQLPFQYDIDVPFPQEKSCGLDFSAKKLWS